MSWLFGGEGIRHNVLTCQCQDCIVERMKADPYVFKNIEEARRMQDAINRSTKVNDPHATQIGGTHYKELNVEPWTAMEAWLTHEEFIGFLRGNIIKYQARANSGKGDRNENLKKAHHYSEKLNQVLAKETK